MAFSRAKQPFNNKSNAVKGVLTIAYVNDQINQTLARLLEDDVQQALLNDSVEHILNLLNGKGKTTEDLTAHSTAMSNSHSGENEVIQSVTGTFTIRNEHGLHARPSAVLVNEVKKFKAKITVENITRNSAAVSAKSLMKIVALGAIQGHRLRFVAEGEDAQQAIEALGKVIAEGLGEAVSTVPPQEADTIETMEGITQKTLIENASTIEEKFGA